MNLKQLLEEIGKLSAEERAEAVAALTPAVASEASEEAEAVDVIADEAVVEAATEVIEDIVEDKTDAAAGEAPDYQETASDESALVEAVEADQKADESVQEAAVEAATPPSNDEDIPQMSRGEADPETEAAEEVVDAAQPAVVHDEQGGEMPIDYQSIIDGLNAKTLALEAENKQLKAKVDGAFGLSGKPGGFVPLNPLYNETGDIPRMRK